MSSLNLSFDQTVNPKLWRTNQFTGETFLGGETCQGFNEPYRGEAEYNKLTVDRVYDKGENGYPFFGTSEVDAQNGRVNLTGAKMTEYSFGAPGKNTNSFSSEAVVGQLQTTCLSDAYFGDKNIAQLQAEVRYAVYQQTGNKIADQNETDLKVIMKSTFLQYSQNLNCKVKKQIENLNLLVIDYCVPNIISNMQQHQAYIKDITTLPVPPPRSINVSHKGSKSYDTSNILQTNVDKALNNDNFFNI